MDQERASKKQQELLSFVDGFIKGNGYGPSYREIMRSLGYKSVSTVAIHIEALIAKGYLVRRDKSARSLEIVSLRPHAREAPAAPQSPSIDEQLRKKIETAGLDTEQARQVAESLRLIGMDDLARAIEPKGQDEASV